MLFGHFPSNYSSCLSLELSSALLFILHTAQMPKTASLVGKKKTIKPAATSPKHLRRLTKDGLRSLLSSYELPTTGTRPQLLQHFTNHMESKDHQNGYAKLTVYVIRQGVAPLEIDVTFPQMLILNPAIQNTLPPVLRTLTQNPAIQSLLANPTLLDRKTVGSSPTDVCHPALSTIAFTLHTYPAVGRGTSSSGDHPCTPHLPSGRHTSRHERHHHSPPRKRRRHHRSPDSCSTSSHTSSSSTSTSGSSWTSSSDSDRIT